MSNRYEIIEQIGKGGLGAVYRGRDTQLQRDVAIKRVLSPEKATEEEVKEAAAKLIAEAQTLSSLNHPNIITVFDVGQDEKGGFVVMELLKGETLDETIERGVLTQEDFTEVVYQTMEALIAAQANNVIHRDIKPTNIMVIWQASGKFQLKILDFGLAKFSKTPSVQTMDQEESVMGSIFFMAPEQFERGELDARTDLYQMGCVYYNALTGQYPFNGETAPQVMNAHLQHSVIPLEQIRPDISPSICQWVMWLINRNIAHRPTDAKEALSRWPRNPEPPGTKPVEELPVEDTPKVAKGAVMVVRGARSASAPPRLIVPSGNTGKTPALNTKSGKLTVTRSTSSNAAKTTGGAKTVSVTKTTGVGKTTGKGNDTTKKYAPEPSPAGKLGGLSRHLKWIVLGVLLLIVSAWSISSSLSNSRAREREKQIRFLAGAPTPTGTAKEVALAVDFLADPSTPAALKQDARKVLERLEGNGISESIYAQMQKASSVPLKITIAEALAERNYVLGVKDMLELFKAATTDDQRISILTTIRSLASPKDVATLLSYLHLSHTIPVRSGFEETILAIIRREGDPAASADAILEKVGTTSGDERKSLFRILGTISGEKVRERLNSIFNESGDANYKRDAIGCYLRWRDRSVLPDLEAIIEKQEDDLLATVAKDAYVQLCTLPGPEPVAEMIPFWNKAIGYAKSSKVKELLDTLLDYPYPETLAMLKEWEKNASYGSQAKVFGKTIAQKAQGIPEYQPGNRIEATSGRIHGRGVAVNSNLKSYTLWTSVDAWFSWTFKASEGGDFLVEVEQASLRDESSEFIVYIAGKSMTGESKRTETVEQFEAVRLDEPVTLEKDKTYVLMLTAGFKVQPRMMDIGAVKLVKP